jgi:hypothetical protein
MTAESSKVKTAETKLSCNPVFLPSLTTRMHRTYSQSVTCKKLHGHTPSTQVIDSLKAACVQQTDWIRLNRTRIDFQFSASSSVRWWTRCERNSSSVHGPRLYSAKGPTTRCCTAVPVGHQPPSTDVPNMRYPSKCCMMRETSRYYQFNASAADSLHYTERWCIVRKLKKHLISKVHQRSVDLLCNARRLLRSLGPCRKRNR